MRWVKKKLGENLFKKLKKRKRLKLLDESKNVKHKGGALMTLFLKGTEILFWKQTIFRIEA